MKDALSSLYHFLLQISLKNKWVRHDAKHECARAGATRWLYEAALEDIKHEIYLLRKVDGNSVVHQLNKNAIFISFGIVMYG